MYNLARSQIERDGKRTWHQFEFDGRNHSHIIGPEAVFGWDLEMQRINQDWRVERLHDRKRCNHPLFPYNPQFAHYLLAYKDMSVADVLDESKRREAAENLSAKDPYWGFAYWDIREQAAFDFHAARRLTDYFDNCINNNENMHSINSILERLNTSAFRAFIPTLNVEDLLRQCSIQSQPQTDTSYNTYNTWFQEARRMLSEDKANEEKATEELDQMAMKFATRLAKHCAKIHDLLEFHKLYKHSEWDVELYVPSIAYTAVWLHQFNTSKEPYFIDRIPSEADMGENDKLFDSSYYDDYRNNYYNDLSEDDISNSDLYGTDRFPERLIRWPSEADMEKLGDTLSLYELVKESRRETYEKGALQNVDFKELQDFEYEVTKGCNQDSPNWVKLKEYTYDGTLLKGIQIKSEGGRLRMTVADSLYTDFGLAPPKRTGPQKTELQEPKPQKAESQNAPPQKAKARAMF